MSDTANRIIDVMAKLIQTRGYSAVSYQDISDAIGIRKASIHYHFPAKADLGVAVIQKYSESLMAPLDVADKDPSTTPYDKLDIYFAAYQGFKGDDKRVCLCGTLAGEYYALPEVMQAEVNRFFQAQQAWLSELFKDGKNSGVFKLPGTPEQTARLYFDALQGALLSKRAIGDDAQIDDVVATLKALVR